MDKRPANEPSRLRQLARELRERARDAELPGYGEKLILAAEELERHAREIEAP